MDHFAPPSLTVVFTIFATVYYYICKLVCSTVLCVSTLANLLHLEFALFATVYYYFCELVLRRYQKRVLGGSTESWVATSDLWLLICLQICKSVPFLRKTTTCPKSRWPGPAPLGSKVASVGPSCVQKIILFIARFALWSTFDPLSQCGIRNIRNCLLLLL